MTTTANAYVCQKCQHREYTLGSMKVSSDGFTAIFDIQDRSFTTVSCQRCGYTEFFKTDEASFLKRLADGMFG
jgi:predicted nucleic-acid-binding Zn-ribbon protein